MPLLEGVRAVAIDLDETLIDFGASRRAGLEALLSRIAAEGLRVDGAAFLGRYRELVDKDDTVYLNTGLWRPTEERLRVLCGEFGMPGDGFAEELNRAYMASRFANLRAFPNVAATLQRLKGRLPLYLVTNGPSAHQHREIEVTGLAPYFTRIFVCDDFGLHKPQVEVFETVRREAGVLPREMLMVGDYYRADIEVPRRLGWRTVWVLRDADERARADPSRADAVVESFAEVPGLLAV